MQIFSLRQCNDPTRVQQRNDCNDKVKNIVQNCLNDTEVRAFSKIENISLRIYQKICDMDQEKMKRKYYE